MEIIFDKVNLVLDEATPLEKVILSDVSFKISKEGVYSFIGNSNSGKTAIAELIDALLRPSKGIVSIGKYVNDGSRIKNVNKLRFNVGYIFKNPYDMFFNTTVKSEVEFGMKYFKYKTDKLSFRGVDALKMVGLDETYLKRSPSSLDLSEARKVAIASVLVFNPSIIILDEPTIGLTKKDKTDLIRLIRMLKDKYKKIVIILSKDTNFAYLISDYIYIMNKTKIVNEGKKEILKETGLLETLGLEVPKIIEFIEQANKKKGVDLNDYTDIKELIKAVYRDVF